MWTVKAILIPFAIIILAVLCLLAIAIVPVLLPEARPYYRQAIVFFAKKAKHAIKQ